MGAGQAVPEQDLPQRHRERRWVPTAAPPHQQSSGSAMLAPFPSAPPGKITQIWLKSHLKACSAVASGDRPCPSPWACTQKGSLHAHGHPAVSVQVCKSHRSALQSQDPPASPWHERGAEGEPCRAVWQPRLGGCRCQSPPSLPAPRGGSRGTRCWLTMPDPTEAPAPSAAPPAPGWPWGLMPTLPQDSGAHQG